MYITFGKNYEYVVLTKLLNNKINHTIMSKFQDIINGDKPVLIDFSAEWCQPCKMMPPILKQVSQQLGDKLRILKVDVDKNQSIARQWGISSVPTIMIFKQGKQVFRQAGVINAQQLITILKPYL